MKIPPSYAVTGEMIVHIAQIESQRIHLASLNLPKPLKEKITTKQCYKQSWR